MTLVLLKWNIKMTIPTALGLKIASPRDQGRKKSWVWRNQWGFIKKVKLELQPEEFLLEQGSWVKWMLWNIIGAWKSVGRWEEWLMKCCFWNQWQGRLLWDRGLTEEYNFVRDCWRQTYNAHALPNLGCSPRQILQFEGEGVGTSYY